MSDVLVAGAGVAGLSVAWRAAQRGLATAVVDPEPGGGAARVAAGMLAAVTELHHGEQTLLALNLTSADRYPRFVAELALLAALAWGGWHLTGSTPLALVAAVVLPALAALVWGRWVAPQAGHRLADPTRYTEPTTSRHTESPNKRQRR